MEFTIKSRGSRYKMVIERDHVGTPCSCVSLAMARQVMEQLNARLRAVFGNYTWIIDGEARNYAIIAQSGNHRFIESTGKTPLGALLNCYQVMHVINSNK